MKIVIILSVIILLEGCSIYSYKNISKDEFVAKPGNQIMAVYLTSGERIDFIEPGANFSLLGNSIAGYCPDTGFISVPLKDIDLVEKNSDLESIKHFNSSDTTTIRGIQNTEGKVFQFYTKTGGGKYYKESQYVVAGVDTSFTFRKINLEDITQIYAKKYDAVKSVGGTICIGGTVILGIGLVAAAAKGSCPFIYSYDGERYVFDKEPLGGATMPILQRTDYSKLKFLKPSGGVYKLMLTNEVDETQYVDNLQLVYADHSPDEMIYPDINNSLYAFKNASAPISVRDENNKDISKLFTYDDENIWFSKMPIYPEEVSSFKKNEIYLSFAKPSGTNDCNLIINAGTTLWGSKMLKEMLKLYGNGLDDYYKKMNEGKDDFNAMMSFIKGEELYQLKLYAKVNGKWEYKTTINGGGPFKSETRVYSFDISDISGDTLQLKVVPPVGFWTFDYAAVNYDKTAHPDFKVLNVKKAVDNNSNDILKNLLTEDRDYYSMPDTSCRSYIEFDAPEVSSGKVRTIFASTSGWYDIHLKKTGSPDIMRLMELGSKPGSVVKFSNERYVEWVRQSLMTFNK